MDMKNKVIEFEENIMPILLKNDFKIGKFNKKSFIIKIGEKTYDYYPKTEQVLNHSDKKNYTVAINDLIDWFKFNGHVIICFDKINHKLKVVEQLGYYTFNFTTNISATQFSVDKIMYELMAKHFNEK